MGIFQEPTQYMHQYPFRIPNPLCAFVFVVRAEAVIVKVQRGPGGELVANVLRHPRYSSNIKILGSSTHICVTPATCDIKHRRSSNSSPDNDAKVY